MSRWSSCKVSRCSNYGYLRRKDGDWKILDGRIASLPYMLNKFSLHFKWVQNATWMLLRFSLPPFSGLSKFFVGLDLLDVFDVSQFWVVEVVGDSCWTFSSNVNNVFLGVHGLSSMFQSKPNNFPQVLIVKLAWKEAG